MGASHGLRRGESRLRAAVLLAAIAVVHPAAMGSAGEPPAPMTLEAAVAYAQVHNPRVAAAAARLREAQGRIAQHRAGLRPQAGLSAFAFRQGPVIDAFQPGADPIVPPYRWTVGLSLSQVIYDWGQRRAEEQAARGEGKEAAHLLEAERTDVRLVVSIAHFNVLRAQDLLTVARDRQEAAREQLRVAKARFEADVAPRFDVLRAEAEAANADQEVIAAENGVSLAEAAFNTALGRDVSASVALSPAPAPEQHEPAFPQARDAALRHRPHLAALREAVESGRHTLRARRAESRPQLNLSGSYDRRQSTGFSSDYTYSAGLVLTFPFLDSGFNRGRVREAGALLEGDRQALALGIQQVELEVRHALLDLDESRRRQLAAEKEVAAAREARRVADVRYRAGVGTTLEVTDAQVALARAGQNRANAVYDYAIAAARLENAMGIPAARLRAPGPAQGGATR